MRNEFPSIFGSTNSKNMFAARTLNQLLMKCSSIDSSIRQYVLDRKKLILKRNFFFWGGAYKKPDFIDKGYPALPNSQFACTENGISLL